MTGPAEGKLPLEAQVFLLGRGSRRRVEASVYVHLKGYALARVTHLGIEHESLTENF